MNVKNAIVQGKNYRFTVLTPSMIRMEYSEKGVFVDKKTQMVVNRTFDVPEYTVNEKNGELIIETDKARLVYSGGKFAGNNLRVELKNQLRSQRNTNPLRQCLLFFQSNRLLSAAWNLYQR